MHAKHALLHNKMRETAVYSDIMFVYHHFLVSGFNPFEKYACQNGFIFPKQA